MMSEATSASRGQELEVSGTVLEPFLLVSEKLTGNPNSILVGLPELAEGPAFVSWNSVCLLYARMQEMADGTMTLEECGHISLAAPRFSSIMKAAATVTSLKLLYTLGVKFSASRIFRHLEFSQRQLKSGALELRVEIPHQYQRCDAFFRVTKGVFEALPSILGQQHSSVDLEIQDRLGVFAIYPPQSQTVFAKAVRAWRAVVAGRSSLQQLIAQQEELNAQYRELQKAYIEAQAALGVKQRFLSIMSHELRTPLNGIAGATAALRSESDPAATTVLYDALTHSCDAMARMVDSILELARSHETPGHSVNIDVDLVALVEEIGEQVMAAAEEKGLRFELDIAPSARYRFETDGPRLGQTLDRLLDNAVKFTDEGHVALSIRFSDGFLHLDIQDTGIGIPSEQHREVFEPFVQVDTRSTRAYGGAGLGLTLVERQVAAMGGALGMTSSPDSGTTMRLRIPAALSKTQDIRVAKKKHSTRVLVVDDDRINRLVISRMLRKLDWEVDEAANGKEAVEIAMQHDFAAIFMDCEMPVMNGWDASSQILKDKPEPPPIIAVSAYVTDEDRERCWQAGMCDFIAKPISAGKVKRALEQWADASSPKELVPQERPVKQGCDRVRPVKRKVETAPSSTTP